MRPALRLAPPRPFPADWVKRSLLTGSGDDRFRQAARSGLDSLTLAERRGHLPAVTGAVAESVAAMVMDEIGFEVFAQLTERGARGADLLLLSPAENVLVLEVKGTLRAGQLPRLGRSRLRQMSAAWLDVGNAPMLDWGLEAADVFGGVMVVDLVSNTARVAVSADYEVFTPVADMACLDNLLSSLTGQ
ncbi:MAG: hypothetical protein QOE36_410 [Gaiellaceae bacterium]|nr:hypothetical protein [Gaiellaceae bacterium]